MAKKTSVYLKDTVINLLDEEGISFNNDTLDMLIRRVYLPLGWGLSPQFENYYSGNLDIRVLLTAVASLVAMPSYSKDPLLSKEDAFNLMNMIREFINRNDWSRTYDPIISGDYDPERYEVWLSGLAERYKTAARDVKIYISFKDKHGDDISIESYGNHSGFHMIEDDLEKYDYYIMMEQEIKQQLAEKHPPGHYLGIILENWDFFWRFDRKPLTEMEYCLLCSGKPVYSTRMLKDLRYYLIDLTKKYYPER